MVRVFWNRPIWSHSNENKTETSKKKNLLRNRKKNQNSHQTSFTCLSYWIFNIVMACIDIQWVSWVSETWIHPSRICRRQPVPHYLQTLLSAITLRKQHIAGYSGFGPWWVRPSEFGIRLVRILVSSAHAILRVGRGRWGGVEFRSSRHWAASLSDRPKLRQLTEAWT